MMSDWKKAEEEIKEKLWIPRVIGGQIGSIVRGIQKKNRQEFKYLPMEEKAEESVYPRPQLVRESFFSLDGIWEFENVDKKDIPAAFTSTIRVPFPPQAERSGFRGKAGDSFWYGKSFVLPESFVKDRTLLHFGAVDQVAEIYVNGKKAGTHEGGYLPFALDITDFLMPEGLPNRICVRATDTLNPIYPYGKQCKNRGGMWYTPVSGIWQSVWIESLPKSRIDAIKVTPALNYVNLEIEGTAESYEITIETPEGIRQKTLRLGNNRIELDNPMNWTPENPYLYYFSLKTEEDSIKSYFALRTISIKNIKGRNWICLNEKPYYFHGVLDQGYFSDGIYTPVSNAYYKADILAMKELGFNTLRKHIKIEPAEFYYQCDKQGMIVFQDMVNNGEYSFIKHTAIPTFFSTRLQDKNIPVAQEIKQFFETHAEDTMKYLYSFPSVCYYTIFNEGWGQYESDRVCRRLRQTDATRILDATSGWFVQAESDVESIHVYFHRLWKMEWTKPVIISEFGGFSWMLREHAYNQSESYGYGSCNSGEELTDQICQLYEKDIVPNLPLGINGSIYTQLSDVEDEVNGLYTYDRQVCKVDKKKMRALAGKVLGAFYGQFEA